MEKRFVFKGKEIGRVGFFGSGASNLALLDYLKKRYPYIEFTLRSDAPVKSPDGILRSFFGKDIAKDPTEDLLFFSPSVRRERAELQRLKETGMIFSSDVEFFFEKKAVPVFSVTGSDGKSTTVTIASLMMSESVGSFPASANIGVPITSLLENDSVCGTVAELSSFQLSYFSPRSERALITNVSENHLDWHSSFDEYVLAKENVLRFAEKRIFNLDSKICRDLTDNYEAFAVYSKNLSCKAMQKLYDAEHYFSVEDGHILHNGKKFLALDEILCKGEHNITNFLAANALCADAVDKNVAKKIARSFTPLHHRCELVGIYDGISFYDSSIDSTPTRTRTTLSAFSAPTVLILGGRGKNLSYENLFPINRALKAVVLTGENHKEIQAELFRHKEFISGRIPVYYAEDFYDCTELAISLAVQGDAVLLSQASTSFDKFSDYKQRGKIFSDIIKKHYAAP